MTGLSTAAEIKIIFQGYQRSSGSIGFPKVGVLGEFLNREVQKARTADHDTFIADKELVKLFASAAVEMWHRALHSFVVSAGLTDTSPLWSSVAGYYASHYVVRGYAHLLGRYVLYRHRKIASLFIKGGQFYCSLDGKGASDREHKTYWKFVKTSGQFGADPFFMMDNEAVPVSDNAHRTKANYFDHVANFSAFRALTIESIVSRIERVANVSVSAVPVPDADEYPDLESVQIVAYHRIVRFRQFLDNLLGEKYNYWNVHRNPQWCADLVDFQVTEPKLLLDVGL